MKLKLSNLRGTRKITSGLCQMKTLKFGLSCAAMIARNLRRFAASSGTAALVLTGMLFTGSVSIARAQSEGAPAHEGLEGAWRLQLTVRDCHTGQARRTFPALATFAKGGTVTLTTAGQNPALSTTGLGVWRHTDDHSYTAVSESFVFSPTTGGWIQTHRLTRAIEIDVDGDRFTETVALEILDTSGNVIVTGCATSVGTRFK